MTDKEIVNARNIGIDGMLWQTQEECGELIRAIAKLNRSRGIGQYTEKSFDDALSDLVAEIADVEICIKHIKYLLDIDTEDAKNKAIEKVYNRYSKLDVRKHRAENEKE